MAEPPPYNPPTRRTCPPRGRVPAGDARGPVVHALHREGVHAGIEVADHRSHVEEARDGLIVCIECLQVDEREPLYGQQAWPVGFLPLLKAYR